MKPKCGRIPIMKNFIKIAVILLFITSCNTNDAEITKSRLAEKMIRTNVSAFIKAWNANDAETVVSLSTVDLLRTTNGNPHVRNQDGYVGWMSAHHAAFPDANIVLDVATVSDSKAFIYWTFTGTNTGQFGNVAATNQKVENHGFSIWTLNNEGKLTNEDVFYDNLSIRQQLGYELLPPRG